jgi:diaminopimelate epimerase
METEDTATLRLSKHEGAGNDFLVMVDLEDRCRLSDAEVQSLCDRRRGVGADGLIRILGGDGRADLTMELRNADGGPAETSGNGLRCLAQAAVEAGLVEPPRFSVGTGAGVATIEFEAVTAVAARATVDMGVVRLVGPPGTDRDGRPLQRADTGNPHVVVRCEDPALVDLAVEASVLAAAEPAGANVEYIAAGPGEGEITMRVYERGVGETWACGSGSCAAAAAARSWGLVGDRVSVRNRGGTLEVALGRKDGDPVLLSGPVRRVATIEIDRSVLA